MMIRPLRCQEFDLLPRFLFLAIHLAPGEPAPQLAIVNTPDLRRYYVCFGRPGDRALAAEMDGQVVGLAWFRLFPEEDAGYGWVSPEVPELSMAVEGAYRGQGIGTKLLKKLELEGRMMGARGLSLSVSKGNPAFRLYQRLGYEVLVERTSDFLMMLKL